MCCFWCFVVDITCLDARELNYMFGTILYSLNTMKFELKMFEFELGTDKTSFLQNFRTCNDKSRGAIMLNVLKLAARLQKSRYAKKFWSKSMKQGSRIHDTNFKFAAWYLSEFSEIAARLIPWIGIVVLMVRWFDWLFLNVYIWSFRLRRNCLEKVKESSLLANYKVR